MASYLTLLEGVEFRNGTVIFDRYARWNFAVSSIVPLTQEVSVLLMSLQLGWSW